MQYTDAPPPTQPDLADIQGFIIRGYTHPCSVHMLYQFSSTPADLPNISGFIKALLPYLRNAEDWGAVKPEIMLNIGLTAGGITIVRPDLNIKAFPYTFYNGPWSSKSAQQSLMDYGAGAPNMWWNQKFANTAVHCAVHAYAMNPDAQAKITDIIAAAAANSNGAVTELLPLNSPTGRLEQYPLIPSDYIHFRYRDSIDEPDLNDNPTGTDQADLNNFLIGYSQVTSPIPGPTTGPEGVFANNGCYNAFRVLYQDVATFDGFLETEAERVAPIIGKPKEYTVEWLAAKLNGRWRNGSPLVLSPDEPEHSTSKATEFGYKATDMQGLKCPFSAHTRVANPRDEGVKVANSTIVPRIIRRGVAYGAPLHEDNVGDDRGLIGLFLCGDINGQFETLYGWMNMNNFSPVFPKSPTPQDALVANRPTPPIPSNMNPTFTIPMADGTPVIVPDPAGTNPYLPQFVVTRGTAYFLLPSISALMGIAGVS
jgi:deferrochelatase/peroxidase EfeB